MQDAAIAGCESRPRAAAPPSQRLRIITSPLKVRSVISGPPPPIAAQVDPYGPNLFQALNDQLGLKLEPRTRALEIMVVDHIEPPTEN